MSVKSLLRGAIALVADSSGLLGAYERRKSDTLTILCYHRVLPHDLKAQYFDHELVVTPEMLDLHCATLSRHYEVVTLEDGLSDWQQGRQTMRPRAAITFDDGYRDNEIYAAPILARYGLKATFYVVAGLVGSNEQPWYDRAGGALRRLGRKATEEVAAAKLMSPAERSGWLKTIELEAGVATAHQNDLILDEAALQRLAAAGHRIGSHSVTHPLLDQLANAELDFEIAHSRELLEGVAGVTVSGFCYPNGNFDTTTKDAVARAHYDYAVSSKPGVNRRGTLDSLELKRWFISQERLVTRSGAPSAALLRMEISGLSQLLFRREAKS